MFYDVTNIQTSTIFNAASCLKSFEIRKEVQSRKIGSESLAEPSSDASIRCALFLPEEQTKRFLSIELW